MNCRRSRTSFSASPATPRLVAQRVVQAVHPLQRAVDGERAHLWQGHAPQGDRAGLGAEAVAVAGGAGLLAHERGVVVARPRRLGLPDEPVDLVHHLPEGTNSLTLPGTVFTSRCSR